MWTRQDVKTLGKAAMKANYFNSVAAALLLAFCTGALFGSTGSSTGQEVQELSGQGLPPEIQAMMDKMSVEATLKQIGRLVSPEFIHKLNYALNQVKKDAE